MPVGMVPDPARHALRRHAEAPGEMAFSDSPVQYSATASRFTAAGIPPGVWCG